MACACAMLMPDDLIAYAEKAGRVLTHKDEITLCVDCDICGGYTLKVSRFDPDVTEYLGLPGLLAYLSTMLWTAVVVSNY